MGNPEHDLGLAMHGKKRGRLKGFMHAPMTMMTMMQRVLMPETA